VLKPTPDVLHRLSHRLYWRGLILPARISQALIFLIFSALLRAEVAIGKRTRYGHGGVAVVLSSNSTTGGHILIAPSHTIGGRSRQTRFPVVEVDVYIGAGAMIVGELVIGHHSIVGANAVVLPSVPAHSVAVRVPARVVRAGIDPFEFEDRWGRFSVFRSWALNVLPTAGWEGLLYLREAVGA